MPNFQQIQELRRKYANESMSNLKSKVSKSDIENIIKYSESKTQLNEALVIGNNPNLFDYLENQKEAHLVTLFIDICSFSTKVKNLTNSQLSIFLDNYYGAVIPIIYDYGGEVEKIIGDGIIAIFGQPFLKDSLSDLLDKADKCAKRILIKLEGSVSEVKIALHDGKIQYYKNKAIKSTEYTIIGSVLTDLFRLESISMDNRLNYYCQSSYDDKFDSDVTYTTVVIGTNSTIWKRSREIEVNLKGVDYNYVRNYKKVLDRNQHEYDIEKRIDNITKLVEKNYLEIEPQEELFFNHDQGIIFRGGVLSVSLNNDFEKNIEMKALHLIFSEITEILKTSDACLKIEVNNSTIQAIYRGHYLEDLSKMYKDAMRVSALKKILSYKFNKKENVNLKLGIGLDFGDIYVYKNPNLGIIYSGVAFDRSKTISKFGEVTYNDSIIMMTSIFYTNLKKAYTLKENQIQYNSKRECYQSSYVNTHLYDWYQEKCK